MLLDIEWPNDHCDFMARLKNITFDKTICVLFRVVHFQSNNSGRKTTNCLDEYYR